MKNEEAIIIYNLQEALKKINLVLQLHFDEAIESCKHYRYDDEAYEMGCDINPKMESENACLKCNNYEEKEEEKVKQR